ncbi:MAG TPA: DinB family protein [Chitinophagaceae bacterium]|jgi:uncharacterized damage-inducible protein DinB|nr:DinB family protein [Chitinophagaceae bacterium]
MKMTAILLKEMDREAITTRKMLERVPANHFQWKPHEKSMSLMQLATHVAEIPTWVAMVLNTTELDFAKGDYKPTVVNSTEELLGFFEKSLAEGRERLAVAEESELEEIWTMRSGDTIFSSEPKLDAIRMCYCQIVHHRAQLGVYLRLLNIPIPGSYGPSADESAFA